MIAYTKEQQLHLDIPEPFRKAAEDNNAPSTSSFDTILLLMIILSMLEDSPEKKSQKATNVALVK